MVSHRNADHPATTADPGLRDKVVLVTGAASGIGRATALAFADAGAHVVLADLEAAGDAGRALAGEIAAAGGQAAFLPCDVTVEQQVDDLIGESVRIHGRLDMAFNSAGISGDTGETHQCTAASWDRVLDVNLRGLWLCLRGEIAQMLDQGGGAIVNCASVCGLVGRAGAPAYTASKHAVVGLTRSAALENARRNIRINAVCPGVVDTPMVARIAQRSEGAMAQLLEAQPIGRLASADEIASAVLWLCSPRASFVTGQALAVDGGWVAQ